MIELRASDWIRESAVLHAHDSLLGPMPSADRDVHFPEALVRVVVEEHTVPGEVVLDPFAGYGDQQFA